MPRSKDGIKRKRIEKNQIEAAIKCIQKKEMTIGEAAKHYEMKKPTLIYHLHKLRESNNTEFKYSPKKPKKVFTDEEELLLVQYLKSAANMHYGLTLKQVRVLAYEYAVHNNKKFDKS